MYIQDIINYLFIDVLTQTLVDFKVGCEANVEIKLKPMNFDWQDYKNNTFRICSQFTPSSQFSKKNSLFISAKFIIIFIIAYNVIVIIIIIIAATARRMPWVWMAALGVAVVPEV